MGIALIMLMAGFIKICSVHTPSSNPKLPPPKPLPGESRNPEVPTGTSLCIAVGLATALLWPPQQRSTPTLPAISFLTIRCRQISRIWPLRCGEGCQTGLCWSFNIQELLFPPPSWSFNTQRAATLCLRGFISFI